jgi:addiction module RelE/StbE family toxin
MVRINWTEQSRKDLKDIYDYISRDSKKYAKHQVVKLQSKTKLLKKAPKIGRVVTELDNSAYRELIEGNYRIIYKILGKDSIDILTVHHSAKDFSKEEVR